MPKASSGRGGAPKRSGASGGSNGAKFGGAKAGYGKPTTGRTAGKPGARGAGAGGKKERWSSDMRQSRGLSAERPRGGASGRSGDERPNWEPRRREDADAALRDARASTEFRTGRPARREERPPFRGREERPFRGRDDRSPREERPYRGRDERPAPDDRFRRDDRPARRERAERPERADRSARTWAERPSRDDRPARDRDQRPVRSREERPAFGRSSAPRRPDPRGSERRPSFHGGERRPDVGGEQRDSRVRAEDALRREPVEDVVLERLEGEVDSADTEGVTFGDLGIGANIVRVLAELGAATPFPIQAATIPDALAGRDVLGRGRTGSGKTIAFAAPLVERILRGRADRAAGERRKPGRAPEALILAPTRELALQIDRTVQPIAQSVGLFTTQVYGGVPYARQYGALSRGVDIVIGTPGRVEDLIEQGRLDLSRVSIVVLDEADHMTDLGFLEPVQRILRRTADDGQRMLFSATLDTAVAALVDEFLADPAVHEVAGEDAAASTIEHLVFTLDQRDKLEVLAELAGGPSPKLVFVRTRSFAEDVADLLDDHGIDSVALHGDLTQPRRTRNLERFSRGRATALVATDVAARGIHIDDVALVIQADAPDEYKTYLHRSGRTGRAGKDGVVVTLVAKNRRRRVEELLSRAGIQAEWSTVRPGDGTIRDLVERVNAVR